MTKEDIIKARKEKEAIEERLASEKRKDMIEAYYKFKKILIDYEDKYKECFEFIIESASYEDNCTTYTPNTIRMSSKLIDKLIEQENGIWKY